MNNKEVENFCTGVGNFAWNNDFEQFCEVCGFDPNHAYSMGKWEQFRALNRLLSEFDNNIMTKILRTGLKLPPEVEV